ncbi:MULTISPECIES: hypothetical protein [unclassified Pseudodesulfovibrio]|uniref:hypothetical protein n=1 Tax=unclassified Pseudodesulfovibrio TaxID=2661612 RepID=UPI000FEB8DC5|nr:MULTISPECIES: hypothetical protein [unclassified Pseudodesulfovibrio]MCJ2165228.1 hypothetical protein [Pseudodesulfovibrio sp. S3-i]
MKEMKPTKSYILTPEAIEAINALDEKIEGKFKSEIVSEAIVQYALAHKIKVKGRKKKDTIEGVAKRAAELERTVRALCRVVFDYECDLQKQRDEAKRVLTEAVDSDTPRNAEVLWKEKEEYLPECMQDKNIFMIYLGGYGIPKKKS